MPGKNYEYRRDHVKRQFQRSGDVAEYFDVLRCCCGIRKLMQRFQKLPLPMRTQLQLRAQ